MNINYQQNYHIIPFAYEKPYLEAIESFKTKCITKDEKKINVWRDKVFNDRQRIFSHINELIESKNPVNCTIGMGFVLEEASRKKYNFTANKNRSISFIGKDVNFDFSIPEIEVYIFESQIGFVCLKAHIKSDVAEEIIEGNYNIKNLYQNKDKFFTENFVDGSKKIENIPIHSSIEKILEDLKVNTYFENDDKFPKQSLVYNVLFLEENPGCEKIEKYMYKMKRLFKDTYIPCKRELNLDNCKDSLQLFDNSYWGISLEGFANLVYLVDDEKTNAFIKGNYKGSVGSTYYYMYLLTLYQRYSLLNFSVKTSEVKRLNNIDDVDESTISNLSELKHDIAYFYLRGIFNNISNITHQAMLYDLMRENLRIDELMNELNSELDGVKTILEERKSKKLEEESKELENKKDSFNRFIAIFSVVFVVIQTANSIWDMFNKGCQGQIPSMGTLTFYCFIFVIALTAIGSGVLTYMFVKRIKK